MNVFFFLPSNSIVVQDLFEREIIFFIISHPTELLLLALLDKLVLKSVTEEGLEIC